MRKVPLLVGGQLDRGMRILRVIHGRDARATKVAI
jgi:hypothetical protein